MAFRLSEVASRMDQLYEFDREPVTEENLKPGVLFASVFAGEHVAATEFVIGAFFVLHGVTASDLILGLLLGNLLAVLSWTFICAPIAVDTRLTLYWYLRKIAGPGVTLIYNVANAFLYCILAGAMISVSATAVGLAFKMKVPGLNDVFPNSVLWVVVCLVLGALFTLLAILGFEKLSRFAEVVSPWIFLVFIAGALVSLPKLGVRADFSNFWEVATTKIWNGIAAAGQEKLGFWHIVFFAWFCNLAMNVGLSDMAIFRYAKKWTYGLYSAFGVYSGHFLAWICSGVMVAAIGREMHPGKMAFEALGLAGALGVLLAGINIAPDSAAYKKLVIKPQMVRDLTHASGSINTINGEVGCAWSRGDRQVKLEAVIPVGSEAEIYIPVFKLRNLKLSEGGTVVFADNQLRASLPGIKGIEQKGGNLIIRVGSGRYSFKLTGE